MGGLGVHFPPFRLSWSLRWRFLGVCSAVLGPLGSLQDLQTSILIDFGPVWSDPGAILEPFWTGRTTILRLLVPISRCFLGARKLALAHRFDNCLHCCRKPLLAFTWAFRSPPAARRYVRSTWNWPSWRKDLIGVAHLNALKINVL